MPFPGRSARAESSKVRFDFPLPELLIAHLRQALGAGPRRQSKPSTELPPAFDPKLGHVAASLAGTVIFYDLLFSSPPLAVPGWSDEELATLGEGVSRQRLIAALEAAEPLAAHSRRQRRAYAGWLITHRRFVEEQAELLNESALTVAEFGWPQSARRGLVTAGGITEEASGRAKGMLSDFTAFLARWQLANLAAPGLPVPLGIDYAGIGPSMQPAHAADAVVRTELPRVMGTLPEAELRRALESTMSRNDLGEHLREWTDLVSARNTGKQSLDRFARWLPLVHYWRVLHTRHPEVCHRSKGRLMSGFARFLDVEPSTVKDDLAEICRRLGHGWENRPLPLA